MVTPLQSFITGQQAALSNAERQMGLQQQRQAQPYRISAMQRQGEAEDLKLNLQKGQLILNSMNAIERATPDPQKRFELAQRMVPELKQYGVEIDSQAFSLDDFTDQGLNIKRAELAGALTQGQERLSAYEQELNAKTKAITGAINPQTGKPFTADEARSEIVLRGAGIVGREGVVSAQEKLAKDPYLTTRVAQSQAEIAGAKAGRSESAKLAVKSMLEPQIQAAVELAKQRAKNLAATEQEEKSNERALAVYETGISNLVNAFGEATTGPGFGLIPAFTANQQILDGAIRVMSPLLKDVFRSAGEGTFSDGDRITLEKMLPDRSTKRDAAIQQIRQVDDIVQLKLGGDPRSVDEIMKGATKGTTQPATQQIRPATSQQSPPVITTQEQFDALPSGALFIEDGVQYRKP